MIKRLDHVHVVAKDMDASIEFYTKVLGFPAVAAGAIRPRRRAAAEATWGSAT